MQFKLNVLFIKLGLSLLMVFLSFLVMAQPTGLLYDPEPPVDSAYVRVILASPAGGGVDVLVDGRVRVEKLASGKPSDYLVLAAGKHAVALHVPGKPAAHLSTTFDVLRGKAITLAFATLSADSVPVAFEDKANANKLKALLTVYNLDAKAGDIDVLTADTNTKVLTGIAYGKSASIPVNPISIDLIAVKIGDKVPPSRISIAMIQGGTYSIFLLPGKDAKSNAQTVENKIERFTGK